MIRLNNQKSTKQDIQPDSKRVELPFGVAIDDRELRAGWDFQSISAGSKYGNRYYGVDTTTCRLLTGDYSLVNHKGEIIDDFCIIERKSHADICGSIVSSKDDPERRQRFAEEHERMQSVIQSGGFACVIIEGSPDMIPTTNVNHRSILKTWLGWERNYGVRWIWAGDSVTAEFVAFEQLKQCWHFYCRKIITSLAKRADSRYDTQG